MNMLSVFGLHKKVILSIENVQHRATKIIKNIKHLTYEERLRYLYLPTLVYRRSRRDVQNCKRHRRKRRRKRRTKL